MPSDNIKERQKYLTSRESAKDRVTSAEGIKKESLGSKLTDADTLFNFGAALLALASGEPGMAAAVGGLGLKKAAGEAQADNLLREQKIDAAKKDRTNVAAAQEEIWSGILSRNPEFGVAAGEGINRLTGTDASIDLYSVSQTLVDKEHNKEYADYLEELLPELAGEPEALEKVYSEIFRNRGFQEPHEGFFKEVSNRSATTDDFWKVYIGKEPESQIAASKFLLDPTTGDVNEEKIVQAIGMLRGIIPPSVLANEAEMERINTISLILKRGYDAMTRGEYDEIRLAIAGVATSRERGILGAQPGKIGEFFRAVPELDNFDLEEFNKMVRDKEAELTAWNDEEFVNTGKKSLTKEQIKSLAINDTFETIKGANAVTASLRHQRASKLAEVAEGFLRYQYDILPGADLPEFLEAELHSRVRMARAEAVKVLGPNASADDIANMTYDILATMGGVTTSPEAPNKSQATPIRQHDYEEPKKTKKPEKSEDEEFDSGPPVLARGVPKVLQ